MKTLATMLALAVTLTARAEPTPAPDADRKHLMVELEVIGEVTQVVDVRMDYGQAAVTPGSQDVFYIEGLDRRQMTLNRVAIPNPLELRVYHEPEYVLLPIDPNPRPIGPVRPPGGTVPRILPMEPVSTPHRVESVAARTFKVAIPFHYSMTTLRAGFTGSKEAVMYDARTVIRDFCSRQKGDGECSEWMAANRGR